MGDLQVKRDGAFNTCYVDPGPFSKPGQTSAIAALTGDGATGGGSSRRRPGLRGRNGPRGEAGQKGKKGGTKDVEDPFFCASTSTRVGISPDVVGTGTSTEFFSIPGATTPVAPPLDWNISMSEDFDWMGSPVVPGPEPGTTALGVAGSENTFLYTGDEDAVVWVQVTATISHVFLIFDIENVEIAIGVGGPFFGNVPANSVPVAEATARQYIDVVLIDIDLPPFATQIVSECIVRMKKGQFVTAAIKREAVGAFNNNDLELQSAQITGTVIAYDD